MVTTKATLDLVAASQQTRDEWSLGLREAIVFVPTLSQKERQRLQTLIVKQIQEEREREKSAAT